MIKLRNALLILGSLLFVFGCGPLLLYILGERIGMVSRGANPVGAGLLFYFSTLPATGCLLVGALLWLWTWVRGRRDDKR
ncbi:MULTISPECIES: hypothetical protein [unclassified Rhizobacter]|uniref:hypothetical protein n=1 Tax=unclassified Rhizobacter TaxID=2640088 RepID=UPI0006FE53BF|nr:MULTISPECIES: hypothetical protein [unclassified Rhizobacter]KQU70186.1 hypothetical protein ASC88_28295 [Rhizobacter sp. Root29]KQW00356.1 hypothetical protein ASC98_29010 [Rhizobacter sp. Root1238]KRB08496.1 hypothetical protein ASE08_29485 [Rhizobacter sp. Root16D2]